MSIIVANLPGPPALGPARILATTAGYEPVLQTRHLILKYNQMFLNNTEQQGNTRNIPISTPSAYGLKTGRIIIFVFLGLVMFGMVAPYIVMASTHIIITSLAADLAIGLFFASIGFWDDPGRFSARNFIGRSLTIATLLVIAEFAFLFLVASRPGPSPLGLIRVL